MAQLTPQESFRLGFLLRCAEEGCTPAEIEQRVKLAFIVRGLEKHAVANPVDTGIGLAKTWASLPLHIAGLGIAGSGLLGAGIGYGAAKLQDEDVDPEEAKRQELIAAYKMQADRARRRAQQRGYRRPAPAEPRLFTGD